MKTASRKNTKRETPEATLARWTAGSLAATTGFRYDDLIGAGWEPGQVSYVEVDGLRYETFPVPGGYVAIEWDADGNVCVF